MTVEAEVTRQLGIRFIDARALASEAKLLEGVSGYATKEQETKLIHRATELFYAKPLEEQLELKQRNDEFESIKSSQHSRHRREGDDNSSIHTAESNGSLSSVSRKNSGMFRKVVSLGGMRRKNAVVAHAPGRNANSGVANATFTTVEASRHHPKENPLMKRVTSTGGITSSMKSKRIPASSLENKKKNNRMTRVDQLGEIMDISIPTPSHRQPLECIQSGRDWGEA